MMVMVVVEKCTDLSEGEPSREGWESTPKIFFLNNFSVSFSLSFDETEKHIHRLFFDLAPGTLLGVILP